MGIIAANIIIGALYMRPWWVFFVSALISFLLGGEVFYTSLRSARTNYALKIERYQLNGIVTNLRDGIVVYDHAFKILVFNPAAREIFSLDENEVLEKSFSLKMNNQGSASRYRLFLTVLFPALAPVVHRLTDPGSDVQIVDLTFDEPRMDLRVTTAKMYQPNGTVFGFMKVIRDRTRELSVLRSKSEFITVASHQLRAPLTAVNWAFETLNHESLEASQKDLVQIGVKAAGSLLKIVNDLLDVAKIEEGRFGYQFEEIELVGFLTNALQQAELVARRHQVKVYFQHSPEESVIIIGDPQRLGTVLSNLIDNAIKYNVPNGEVTIGIQRVLNEPFVQISIKDTGMGIPSNVLDKLFTKFFRAENAVKQITEGTGLGLFISKNIIKRHGGKIWAQSVLNRGTTFFITLPTQKNLIPSKEIVYEEEL